MFDFRGNDADMAMATAGLADLADMVQGYQAGRGEGRAGELRARRTALRNQRHRSADKNGGAGPRRSRSDTLYWVREGTMRAARWLPDEEDEGYAALYSDDAVIEKLEPDTFTRPAMMLPVKKGCLSLHLRPCRWARG